MATHVSSALADNRILPTVKTEAGNPSNSIDFLLSLYFRLVRPETLPDSAYQIQDEQSFWVRGAASGNADGEVGLIWNPVVLEYSASIRGVLRCLLSQICEGKKLISLGAGDGTSSKGLLQSIFVLVRDCPLRLLQLMYTSLLDASGHPHVSYGVGNQRVQCFATQTGIPYSVHTMALKGGSMACSQTEIGKLVMWKSLTNGIGTINPSNPCGAGFNYEHLSKVQEGVEKLMNITPGPSTIVQVSPLG